MSQETYEEKYPDPDELRMAFQMKCADQPCAYCIIARDYLDEGFGNCRSIFGKLPADTDLSI